MNTLKQKKLNQTIEGNLARSADYASRVAILFAPFVNRSEAHCFANKETT